MAFLANFGKFILAFAILSHAALLMVDEERVPEWNQNVKHIVSYGKTLHPQLEILDAIFLTKIDCVRYTAVFFESFAVFLLLTNCRFVTLFTFFGVALTGFVQFFPKRNNYLEILPQLLNFASLCGALIFLMGSSCGSAAKKCAPKSSKAKKNQ